MLGKFEEGQQYAFYKALSSQILDFVRASKEENPAALTYRGMDFSHVFESLLYFGTVLDEALNDLAAAAAEGDKRQEPLLLNGDLPRLVAQHWFGRDRIRGSVKARGPVYALLRRGKRYVNWVAGYSAAVPAMDQANLPDRCDVLFYARSQRFADYLAPVARALSERHAFLVPAGAHEVQRSLAAAELPFISASKASLRARPFASMIGLYAPHLGFFSDGVETALMRLRPRVIVVPEGNSPDDEVVNRVGHKLGIPVACLQQGWSPIMHPGFCNLSYDSMMVWGPGFAELLAPHNPLQRFVATGNHALWATFGDVSKKFPGIIFFHQDVDRGLGGKRGSDMMLTLAERIAGANPNLPVYVRPHPLVPLDASIHARLARWPNLVVQKTADVPLAEALGKAAVSVSIYSTTILESVAAGTVPLIFNMTSMPHFWPDVAAEGAGLEVHTLDEAFAALTQILSSNEELMRFAPAMTKFSQRYFVARGPKAIDNIVAELARLANLEVTDARDT